jgi:hypothetical protein
MTLTTKNGEKSKPMTSKWKILWSEPHWSEKNKNHLKWPPIGGQIKKRFEMPPIRAEKSSLELIPIGLKWATIDNEKKVIRVIGHFVNFGGFFVF